jgi:hypothetical protein
MESIDPNPHVLSTEKDNQTAEMTINFADEDHKFDVWASGDTALVEYQETLSYRGTIRVSEPDEAVFKALMTSDKMASLLNKWGVSGVKRASPSP